MALAVRIRKMALAVRIRKIQTVIHLTNLKAIAAHLAIQATSQVQEAPKIHKMDPKGMTTLPEGKILQPLVDQNLATKTEAMLGEAA
jgi:hypothetical protein